MQLNERKILEVGIGNKTISNYLKQFGFDVTTCDHADYLEPDYVADIRELPFSDNEFGLILACEILEHIPFSDVGKALSELCRVTSKYVVISVPYSSSYLEIMIKASFPKLWYKKKHVLLQLPNFFIKHGESTHRWEMGKKGYSKERFRNLITSCNLLITKEFQPIMNPAHYFFVLKKGNT